MASAHLWVNERRGSDEAVLTLTGELDIATVAVLRSAVRDCHQGGAERVVLNLARVTFCDSQGLSALIGLTKELGNAGGSLVLTDLHEFIVGLLEVTGLRPAFTIE